MITTVASNKHDSDQWWLCPIDSDLHVLKVNNKVDNKTVSASWVDCALSR